MTKDVGVESSKGTVVAESPLRRRYLKALEEAQANLAKAKIAYEEAEAKLKAYDLVAPDLLGESSEANSQPLGETEVESIASTLRGTFTYRDVVRVAFRDRGHFVDAVAVRALLNRLAAKEESTLEIVKRGEGQRPSIFKVKKAASDLSAGAAEPETTHSITQESTLLGGLRISKEAPM